jgi:hypothetical protein
MEKQEQTSNGFAIGGIVTIIIGIFAMVGIMGIASIILGALALKGSAWAKVLGVLEIVLGIVYVLVTVIYMSMA